MRSARVVLIAGLALVLAGVALVSLQRPAALARTNGVKPEGNLAHITSHARICQVREVVPRGTKAIVAWIGAFTGPGISTELTVNGHVIAHGRRGSGWTSRTVTIPLSAAVAHTTTATVCFSVTPRYEVVVPRGSVVAGVPATIVNGKRLPGTMAIEYLHGGSRTWLSRAPTIASHLGLGRVPSGRWAPIVAVLLAVAMAAVVVAAGRMQ
jgi:hypothetical protein